MMYPKTTTTKGNSYHGSDGKTYKQSTIISNLSRAYRDKHENNPRPICAACQQAQATDNDHTIAQRRCKELHKTELIWNPINFEDSCRGCHMEWEQYKSGEFSKHKNFERRMEVLEMHDPEGYNKRINYIS